MGWGNLVANATLPRTLVVLLWNLMSLVRTVSLFVVELSVAGVDCLRGVFAGKSWWHELKFVPSRVAICTLLRELVAIGAEVDATRGLPIIHLNLLGYDEQAHRRGPESAFAHWSLGQIDRSIRRICDAAFCSLRRDYQVWIYSDHGQEATVPYTRRHGKTLHQAVSEIVGSPRPEREPAGSGSRGVELLRTEWLGGGLLQRLLPKLGLEELMFEAGQPIVADKGPLGHVYCPQDLEPGTRERIAERLVREAGVPLVFALDEDRNLCAWNADGRFQLPADAVKVFGESHPFAEEVARDLAEVCRHPDAGDLLACGWQRGGQSVSFVTENGAHAGPGPQETCGFALLPADVWVPETDRGHLRPLDLRRAALRLLQRAPVDRQRRRPQVDAKSLRVMTYNVHSCIGLDGRLSAERIARVIAQSKPDIVALQELDVGRARTQHIDQARTIARNLEMELQFHPAMYLEEGQYGNAVLSRFPMRLVRADRLPALNPSVRTEPRGALWVAVDVAGVEVHVINTHLGLGRRTKLEQARALLGSQWVAHPERRGPVILCGDFNARPSSAVYREIHGALRDAQLELDGHRPQYTWSSICPLTRIDHVFVGDSLSVVAARVPKTRLARIASDHRPLVVDVQTPR
jgi:endonuclease/exonuclease/phosphatase family metal-dependent hydrolase